MASWWMNSVEVPTMTLPPKMLPGGMQQKPKHCPLPWSMWRLCSARLHTLAAPWVELQWFNEFVLLPFLCSPCTHGPAVKTLLKIVRSVEGVFNTSLQISPPLHLAQPDWCKSKAARKVLRCVLLGRRQMRLHKCEGCNACASINPSCARLLQLPAGCQNQLNACWALLWRPWFQWKAGEHMTATICWLVHWIVGSQACWSKGFYSTLFWGLTHASEAACSRHSFQVQMIWFNLLCWSYPGLWGSLGAMSQQYDCKCSEARTAHPFTMKPLNDRCDSSAMQD